MFRSLLRVPLAARPLVSFSLRPSSSLLLPARSLGVRHSSTSVVESYDDFNDRWKLFFDQAPDLFELQRGMNNIFAHDLVPAVDVIEAMLFAARRYDDFAVAVRVLDVLWSKVETRDQYDAYMKELKPVCEELGVISRQEIYGQQHLGRIYHGPGEGAVVPPLAKEKDEKDHLWGPPMRPPPSLHAREKHGH